MAPSVALARESASVMVVSLASGVAGAALGAAVSGGIGYVLLRREREEHEAICMHLRMSEKPKNDVDRDTHRLGYLERRGAASPASPVKASAASFVQAPTSDSFASVSKGNDQPSGRPEDVLSHRLDARTPSDASRRLRNLPDPLAETRSADVSMRDFGSAPASPMPRSGSVVADAVLANEALHSPVSMSSSSVLRSIPEVFSETSSSSDGVAPGHGFVGATSGGSTDVYVASPQNPYLRNLSKQERQRMDEYGEVATSYVAKKSFRERMEVRARGVADVLSERLDRNPMEGIPVIERADGSVGDVGANWWDSLASTRRSFQSSPRVEPSYGGAESYMASESYAIHASTPNRETANRDAAQCAMTNSEVVNCGIANHEVAQHGVGDRASRVSSTRHPSASFEASLYQDSVRSVPPAPLGAFASDFASDASSMSAVNSINASHTMDFAGEIARRVATVEEEAYPEIEDAPQSLTQVWEDSLAALDDRVEDNLMASFDERAYRDREAKRSLAAKESSSAGDTSFDDAVGAIETIDEPDGLESDTVFLNFRAPGNHPEVKDTGSYINYLIQDELKRSPSHYLRRQARSYFRVHEGGQNTQAQAV